jgi:DNA-binding MarR family transcriptional regulator
MNVAQGPGADPNTQLQLDLGLLLRMAHRRAAKAATDALDPLRVEGRHLGVLITLARRGPLTQTQLVDALGSEKSAMVRTLDDLEALKAVNRQPAPGDRRARLVALTNTGQSLLRQAQPLATQAAQETFGSLSDDEQHVLHQLLTRLTSD